MFLKTYSIQKESVQVFFMLMSILSQVINHFLFIALHVDNIGMFPSPLKASQEKDLIEKMQNGDDAARKKLIEHNLRLVVHIIKKYYATYCDQDDLISIGTIGLIKGVNSYQSDKGVRLATYAARCIENEILMYFRSQKKTAQDVSLDDPIETDSEGNPLTLMDILSVDDTVFDDVDLAMDKIKIRKFVTEMTDNREKEIIVLRYGLHGEDPITQNEIAEKLGISRSYVSRIETKAIKKLKKRMLNE